MFIYKMKFSGWFFLFGIELYFILSCRNMKMLNCILLVNCRFKWKVVWDFNCVSKEVGLIW